MCGVVGVYGPSASNLQKGILDAVGVIGHRGPDDQDVYVSKDGRCVLGHVRLAIVDLSSAAAQPMTKQDSVLAYNGEIYNHVSLRKDVIRNNCTFNGSSDTETLLCGLRQQGPDFLNLTKGMFAGAWYDEMSGNLILFRDSLGIKPLYLTSLPDSTIIFCSEISGLLSVTDQIKRELDLQTFYCYLSFENYPQNKTLFRGMESLRPGEVRSYCRGSKEYQTSYINLSAASPVIPSDDGELVTQTRALLDESVKNHLMSDVPVGVYLSGGLDSSIVSCLAARHTKGLTAFTGYFEDTDPYYDERPYSRDVANFLGVQLNEVCIKPDDFKLHFDNLVMHLGQPRMGMGSFSQYMVAMLAGKQRKVFLAGHGGDELFAGYPIFKAAWLAQNNWITSKCWKVWLSLSVKEMPWIAYMLLERLRKGCTPLAPAIIAEKKNFLSEETRLLFFDTSASPLNKLQEYYQRLYLPGLLLVEDSVSMAHSLETRVPMWSSDVINWANQINLDEKMPKGKLKGLLRSVAKDVVPNSLLSAPKRGFPTPLRKWLRNELLEFSYDRLLSQSDILDLVLKRTHRERLIKNHVSCPLPFALDERRAHKIWMMLCLESWARQFDVTVSVSL